jgi:hypothetical protein
MLALTIPSARGGVCIISATIVQHTATRCFQATCNNKATFSSTHECIYCARMSISTLGRGMK